MTSSETLRKIFKSPFDYTTYCNEIVHNIFGCNDIATNPEQLPSSSDGDRNHFIGRMTDAEQRELGFFYTRVAEGSDVRRKRVGLRKLIQPYLKYEVEAAIAVFDDGNHWRLSYICDMKGNVTSAKRSSYILGDPQGQYKTPLERLDKVASKSGHFVLDELKEAFSVDALSKEFFDEYHRHYDIIVKELNRYGNSGAIYHDYVKKMLGRIVFLHFLQKKGWLDGNQAFLRDLFFMQPLDRRADFLEKVLEPLFFGIFNTETAQRERLFSDRHWDKQLLGDWSALPYLNGGLFEEDAVDKLHIKLPASLFEDLFTFLASYNFTVDENDPDDAEVGVDPEMLGKIFESLLEDNKAKGAFYTPKEIVRYMCKESLIAYLSSCVSKSPCPTANGGNNLQDSQDFASETSRSIRKFVEHHEMQPELEPYRNILDAALRNVKICDPAIGSGAFPMGLLNELWRCREALYAPSPIGRDLVNLVESNHAVCGINLQDQRDLVSETSRRNEYSRSKLKKEIIENNIYGVDIERGAIDIARLRFWLSIVVDAEEPEPLPNFDYKFMQGNSLIESFDGHDLSHIMDASPSKSKVKGGQRGMFGDTANQTSMDFTSEDTRSNLRIWLSRYFFLTDHEEKDRYRQHINDCVKSYIRQQGIGTTAEDSLNTLDPSANQDFFLWHTWFKDIFDNGGFDIVIGNPPYIQLQADGGKLGNLYKNCGFETFARTGDIYSLFYEQGWNLLNKGGHLCFITSNKWMRAGYGESTRKFFASKTNPLILLDLGANVFENATVDTNILLFSKISNTGKTKCATFSRDGNNSLENLSDFVQQQGTVCSFDSSDSWVILSPIEKSIKRKIEAVGTPLKDWDIQINYGIKTGCNEAFIITTEKRDEILANCYTEEERQRTAELIRPILRGRDIKRYSYEWANLWLIATFPSRHYDIEQYPAVKAHLEAYYGGHGKEVLEQTGATHIINGEKVKSRKKTNNKWFETQDSINYWEDFSQPKIIYQELSQGSSFAIDKKGEYVVSNTAYLLTGRHLDYLVRVLNSSIIEYVYRTFYATMLGATGVRWLSQHILHLPIPLYEGRKLELALTSSDNVDEIVAELYGLSSDEIAFILSL